MSKQTRLNTEQAIALMEQSDEEDNWAKRTLKEFILELTDELTARHCS